MRILWRARSKTYHARAGLTSIMRAQNIEQATDLIENGFEYVTEMDSIKLFRKHK